MRRHLPPLLLFAILAWTGIAQRPVWPAPPQAERKAEPPREIGLEERAAARLGQLDVTAIGPPEVVANLTKDDFRIKIQLTRITEFELDRQCILSPAVQSDGGEGVAESSAPPAAAAASVAASYLFYFDQPHLTMAGRQRSIDVARKLVEELVTDRNRGMIVSNAARTVIVQPLTSDTELLSEKLDELEGDREQWDLYAHTEDDRVDDVVRTLNDNGDVTGAISRARQYQQQEYWTTNRNLRRLSVTLGQLVDLPPPKVLIYFADVVRSNPGAHYMTFFGSAMRDARPVLGAMSGDAAAGGLAFDRVLNEAAAQGIRIYTVEARGLVGTTDPSRTSSVAMSSTLAVPSSSRTRLADTERTLQGMAAESGGYAFLHGVRAGKIAERVKQDSACVYLVSFDPSPFATDQPLRVVVESNRSGVELRTRGRLVLQSASARRTSQLLRAFSTPDSIPDPFAVSAGLVPIGFEKGQYTALLQISAPGLPLSETRWDLGVSLVADQRVRDSTSGRLSASGPNVRVILERQVTLKPGQYELVAVAHEEKSGLVASTSFPIEWPSLRDSNRNVGPIALLQPAVGAFVRQGKSRGSGSLLVGPELPMVNTRPAAFVALVCRGKRKDAVTVKRRLVGESTHEFPDLELDDDDERCAQIRDVVPSNSLLDGYYRYEISLHGSGQTLEEGHRDFVVEPGEAISPLQPDRPLSRTPG